jgi:hypothetical protein
MATMVRSFGIISAMDIEGILFVSQPPSFQIRCFLIRDCESILDIG